MSESVCETIGEKGGGHWRMEQVRWRSVYKSTSISGGVIKSLMKEVDWDSDLLLSCCFLLPVMSSNGIQLTTGAGKNVHGRGGCGCNEIVHACVRVRFYPRHWLPFVKDGIPLFGFCAWTYHMFTTWSSLMMCFNQNNAKMLQTLFCHVLICGFERDVWIEAKIKIKKAQRHPMKRLCF